jgi:hypothetical protein
VQVTRGLSAERPLVFRLTAIGDHGLITDSMAPATREGQASGWGSLGINRSASTYVPPSYPALVTWLHLSASQASGRGRPGAAVRARMPSVARRAVSEMTGKMPPSFQLCSTEDQS